MKKIYSKTISTLLAALFAVSSLSTYAADVKLDFEVESGDSFMNASKESVLLMEELAPELDFTVEDGKLDNIIASEDNYTVSLMSDDDYVLFENGSGTKEDPYIISTPIELLSVAFWVNMGGFIDSYYKLENDINLEGAEWTPIGEYQKSPNTTYAFSGHFDGNGKTVSNFKISKPELYAGFFGLVENGTIKNLTLSDFEITTEYAGNNMYVGGITGIARATSETESGDPAVVIENCHVKNAEITAKSNFRVYGSGHIGYLHSSGNADIRISGCSTNAICNFSVNNANPTSSDRPMLRIGGLIGYVGITDAKINISNSYSASRVTASFTDAAAAERNDVHIGGFVGELALSSDSEATRSKLEVDSCYSTNMVYAAADGDVYAGGFTGYLVSESSDVVISNCHTTSNVYATSTSNTSYLGGFSSIVGINEDTTPIGTIKIQYIYTANNVIDINSKDSIAGKLTSYLLGDTKFESCFAMADSVIKAKEEIKQSSAPEKLITADKATEFTSYEGFDIDTWVPGSTAYPYPSLAENPFVSGSYSAYSYSAGEISEYKSGYSYGDIPEKPDTTPDSHYIFSHWSIYAGGPDVFDGTKAITSDTVYFPNNSSEYKSYDISFSANGEIFDIKSIKYNETVEFPVAPPKPADSLFRYAFSHWSKTENGKAVDTSKETVKGKATYYAVYEKVETGVWDGISTTAYTNGNGTVEKPYEISDAYHLAYLKETVNNGTAEIGAYYVLTKDIDLGGYEWTPIGTSEHPFNGKLCGNGYSVYNFNITKPETVTAGLFGYCMNADISKLEVSGFRFNIENPTEKAYVYAAPIAVYLLTSGIDGASRISECYADGEITIDAYVVYAGGIAGIAKDTDASVFKVENCYSNTDITLASDANSTAGGILGKLDSEQLGLSYIDKCYYAGDITSNSDTQAYAGGIVGYLQNDENWADEAALSDDAVLLEDELTALPSVRNSFYAGSKISTTSALTSYGGFAYGYKSDIACVEKCGYIESASMTAASVSSNKNIFKISKIADLYDAEYVGEKFGFDFEAVWVIKEKNLPVLQIFNQIKNVFRINEYALNGSTLEVELKICYRDVESYLVLLGAYDTRGKMIGFKSVSVTNPAELRTVEMSVGGVDNAVSCTLSVINPKTLAFIEAPVTLTK